MPCTMKDCCHGSVRQTAVLNLVETVAGKSVPKSSDLIRATIERKDRKTVVACDLRFPAIRSTDVHY